MPSARPRRTSQNSQCRRKRSQPELRPYIGTGKEGLAHHAHAASGRSGAFVPVNCAAIPKLVERNGGFVAKYMGDGVLVYFGYPHAHEDDAECAVRAGLALIEAVGKLHAQEQLHRAGKGTVRRAAQNTNQPSRLLRPCCGRPRSGATEKRDEVPAPHSITSLANHPRAPTRKQGSSRWSTSFHKGLG